MYLFEDSRPPLTRTSLLKVYLSAISKLYQTCFVMLSKLIIINEARYKQTTFFPLLIKPTCVVITIILLKWFSVKMFQSKIQFSKNRSLNHRTFWKENKSTIGVCYWFSCFKSFPYKVAEKYNLGLCTFCSPPYPHPLQLKIHMLFVNCVTLCRSCNFPLWFLTKELNI